MMLLHSKTLVTFLLGLALPVHSGDFRSHLHPLPQNNQQAPFHQQGPSLHPRHSSLPRLCSFSKFISQSGVAQWYMV